MSIFKKLIILGAGIIASAVSYMFMRDNNEVNNQREPIMDNTGKVVYDPNKEVEPKSVVAVRKLDNFQVGCVNLARFISDVVRSISLLIRATSPAGFNYNNQYYYNQGQQSNYQQY